MARYALGVDPAGGWRVVDTVDPDRPPLAVRARLVDAAAIAAVGNAADADLEREE